MMLHYEEALTGATRCGLAGWGRSRTLVLRIVRCETCLRGVEADVRTARRARR